MVVGGIPESVSQRVELIDLTDQNRRCKTPQNYPLAVEGPVGAFFDNSVIVCGGGSNATYTSSACYKYNPENASWSYMTDMIAKRSQAASIVHGDKFWITGGRQNGMVHSSTEVLHSSNYSFTLYTSLPSAIFGHNLLNVDLNYIILLGGRYSSYVFNVESHTWKQLPSLLNWRAESHAGLAIFNNGSQAAVIAGGQIGRTELLFLDSPKSYWLKSNEMKITSSSWVRGPDMPYNIKKGASVQLNDTFIIVGGIRRWSRALNTIWKFDIQTEKWTMLKQMLKFARSQHIAFLVPDEYC